MIQETPGLTNLVAGHGTELYGSATLDQLVMRYIAPTMEIKEGERVIAINISASTDDRSVYEAVRFAWVVNKSRAERADYVLAVTDGICLGVFVADSPWEVPIIVAM